MIHSRAVAVLSLFLLACLIGLGLVALHLTAASVAHATEDAAAIPSIAVHAGAEATADAPRALNEEEAAYRPIADSLARLLNDVYAHFAPASTDINNAMIPSLADVITLINQRGQLRYYIEVYEHEPGLAQRRSVTLNDVLRLNVLEPAHMTITPQQGRPGIQVRVTGP